MQILRGREGDGNWSLKGIDGKWSQGRVSKLCAEVAGVPGTDTGKGPP